MSIERADNSEKESLENLSLSEAAKRAPEFYKPSEWTVKVGQHIFAWAPEAIVERESGGRIEFHYFGENTDFVKEWDTGRGPIENPGKLTSSVVIGPKGQWISTKTGEYVDSIPAEKAAKQ